MAAEPVVPRPATLHTLRELAQLPDTAAVLAVARERAVRPIRPVIRREDGRLVVVLPEQPGVAFDVADLPLVLREPL